MFDTTFQQLSGMDRPSVYYRTLFQCLAMLDPTQWRRISAKEMCKAAGMSHVSAQRGLAMLQEDRVIFGQGQTASRAYRLNNRLISMTSSEKWNNLDPDPEVIDARGRS